MDEEVHRICRTCFFTVRPGSGLDIPWSQPGLCCWCNLMSIRTVIRQEDTTKLQLPPQCQGIHIGDVTTGELERR